MSTTLDPGFVGNFIFSICNNSSNVVTLYCRESKIATLVLYSLKQKTRLENNNRSGHITSLNAAGISPDEETLRMMHREEHHNYSTLQQLVKESAEYKSLKKEDEQRLPKRMRRLLIKLTPIFIIIFIFVGIFMSSLPDTAKLAISPIISAIAVVINIYNKGRKET